MIKMFQNFNIFGRKQQDSALAVVDELPVVLNMPAGFHGKTVPASIVVMELLWQQYGLDILHPEVDRWLEQHAPDIKYAIAGNRFASSNDCMFEVGPEGTIELHLSLRADDRLREVASQYILSQAQHYSEITEREAGAMPPASVPRFTEGEAGAMPPASVPRFEESQAVSEILILRGSAVMALSSVTPAIYP